jgi:hypothetical protein
VAAPPGASTGRAYVPGLRVTPAAVLRRARRLPVPGEVLVRPGQAVGPEDVVARARVPGAAEVVAAAALLGVEPADLPRLMAKRAGDPVAAGEALAAARGPFGLGRRELRSPCAGTVELVSPVTGHVTLRRPPAPVEVRAHLAGRVAEVLPGEGAVVEARGALIQGIFGVGGERRGPLAFPEGGAGPPGGGRGAVWVVPGPASGMDLRRAAEAGAVGLVAASIPDADLVAFAGRDYAVGVTGEEDVPLVLVLTEGFGRLEMARRTAALLRGLAGRPAALSGATQIRAGVLRPEVFVPEEAHGAGERRAPRPLGLVAGATVRLIRTPEFGAVGRVVSLPAEPEEIATGARVRVVRVRLRDGQVLTVPRANVELVEE